MAPVTVDAGSRNSYYSAGNVGWSARSAFAYRTAIQNLAGNTTVNMGELSTNIAMAQSFTTVGAIDVNEIRVAVQRFGTPADNLTCAIYSDTGANKPNASLQAADNVYVGSALSTTSSWLAFQFATPVALSATTKYWIVLERSSGTADGSNYYRPRVSSASSYAGGGTSTSNAGVWGAESATLDYAFQVLTELPSALYTVTQSTTPELHVWKSTDDGASWTEQDTADNPSVTSATHPFDACDTRSGPYIVTARFTAANTFGVLVFDMSTDQWDAADFGTTPATDVSNERSIRVSCDNRFTASAPGGVWVAFTDTTDDADISARLATTAAGAWGTQINQFAVASTEASLCSDATSRCDP
jgi:hypothetical protein